MLHCGEYAKPHLLFRKVVEMAIWAPTPSRRVKSLGGDKVLEVPIGSGAPSGGVKLLGGSRALCKVVEMPVRPATPPGRVKPLEDSSHIGGGWWEKRRLTASQSHKDIRPSQNPIGWSDPISGGSFSVNNKHQQPHFQLTAKYLP